MIVKICSHIISTPIRTHQIKHITVIDILLFSGSTITGNTIYLRMELFDNVKHDFYFLRHYKEYISFILLQVLSKSRK